MADDSPDTQPDAQVEKVLIRDLQRNLDFYPRNKLDRLHVRRLSEALEMGATFPPITADRNSRIVTDGWHRCAAIEDRFGDNGEIEVTWEDHPDMASVFMRAAGEASVSKLPLTPYDQARIVVRAEELGVPLERVASALNTPVEKLRGRVSLATSRPMAHSPGLAAAGTVVLKRDLNHLEGQELNEAQVEANRKAGGLGVTFYAQQIKMRLATDTINWADGRNRKALIDLHAALGEALLENGVTEGVATQSA